MDDWYHPENFEPGQIYVDAEGELRLEFAGTLTAKAARRLVDDDHTIVAGDDNEPVLLFLVVNDIEGDDVTFYAHSKLDADRGYGFVSLSDLPADQSRDRSNRE